MSFQELKNTFTWAGVNLFPEDDAFCYAEGISSLLYASKKIVRFCYVGTCEKHFVMESHLYDCMAAVALTHNFTWSRWNFLSGRRSCVVLMREIIENRKTVRSDYVGCIHVTEVLHCTFSPLIRLCLLHP